MARGRMLERLVLVVVALAGRVVVAVTLTVSSTGGNASSPLLYGIMFEDINNSGDGGIHGQLLRNNGFQGTNPGLAGYAALGGASLSVDAGTPLSAAITSTLRVAAPNKTTTTSGKAAAAPGIGFSNAGYLGVPVNRDTYTASFWLRGDYAGDVALGLYGPGGAIAYATRTLAVASNASAFTYVEATLRSGQSFESGVHTFNVTFDAARVRAPLNVGLVQLFPKTYRDRKNGLRDDVATYLEQMRPSFLRFPGGNNLEGATPDSRWKWNETIGPVETRPGRQGTWTYANTDALGLMEYFDWCADMGMEPLLAVWAGLSLGDAARNRSSSVVAGAALQPYIADVLAQLEFLLGDAATTAQGALRARLGRPQPYALRFVEVGNEDGLAGGCASYASRFADIAAAVRASPYGPRLTLVASTADAACLPKQEGQALWVDAHHYLRPDEFVARFGEWDHYPRGGGGGVVVGEYASTRGNDGAATFWSYMQGSCAEAVYMIGMERNSDVVKMASFAPLLEHFDMAEWSPALLGVNSTAGSITGSTSFWVQAMFSANRGDTILPVAADGGGFGPLYWVASSRANASTYYVKLANYGASAQPVTVRLPDLPVAGAAPPSAQLTLLAGGELVSNFPGIVSVTPQNSSVPGSPAAGYSFSMPPWAVAVVAVDAAGGGQALPKVGQSRAAPAPARGRAALGAAAMCVLMTMMMM